MDYKALLAKYMRHVYEAEGICFLPVSPDIDTNFTQQEIDELRNIRNLIGGEL